MGARQLDIDELLLDLENPRISRAGSQREAIQRIIEDQDVKLVVLAESIVADGLNPMDRWLVLKSPDERGKYIVLEGNRRLATIRMLHNSAVMNDLEVRQPVKKKLEELAGQFDVKAIEPIDCFEIADRAAAAPWLNQRHTGENKGSGIVNWGGIATARFRGRDPALQAFEFVLNHGSLQDEEKELLHEFFPISTLDRLLSTPAVRQKLGLDIVDSKLITELPASEAIKALRRIAMELATGAVNVTQLKHKDQQVAYVSKLGRDLPNLTKRSGPPRHIDALGEQDFKPTPAPKPKPKPRPPLVRKTLIPRDSYIVTVSNPKIAEIVKELRSLLLVEYPHAISVLFRVFLEQSTDHYLTASGISLEIKTNGGPKEKSLRTKVGEAVAHMIKNGVQKRSLDGVTKGIDDPQSPLYVNTLHNYVHNRFYSPTERELKVAWDNSQLYFETIWK
jgi:hypothetical protein